MPGSPLLNIGTALGGLTSGYNQSQNQAIQQALARLQLQQAQGAQNSQGLAALALQAGLLGNSSPNPLQSLPTPTASSMPGPTPVVAPQINVPQNPAPQPPPPGVPVGTTNPPVPSDVPPQPADAGIFDYNDAIAAGRAEAADAKAQQPQPTPSPSPPTPGPQSASAGASDTGDTTSAPQTGGSVGIQLPGGQTIDMSTMFKTVDYGKLAQGIAQIAPPGTSQADIFNAVLDLGKLAEGDKVQQQQAGLLLRALVGGNFKLTNTQMQTQAAQQRVNTQAAAAQQRVDTQQTGATGRQSAAIASREKVAQEQIASREKIASQAQDLRRQSMDIRNANQQRALDLRQQAVETAMRNANRGDMATQITAIRARISTIKPDAAGNYSDQQQAQLRTLNDKIAAIAANASAAGP